MAAWMPCRPQAAEASARPSAACTFHCAQCTRSVHTVVSCCACTIQLRSSRQASCLCSDSPTPDTARFLLWNSLHAGSFAPCLSPTRAQPFTRECLPLFPDLKLSSACCLEFDGVQDEPCVGPEACIRQLRAFCSRLLASRDNPVRLRRSGQTISRLSCISHICSVNPSFCISSERVSGQVATQTQAPGLCAE